MEERWGKNVTNREVKYNVLGKWGMREVYDKITS